LPVMRPAYRLQLPHLCLAYRLRQQAGSYSLISATVRKIMGNRIKLWARLPAKRPAYPLQMPHICLIRSLRQQAGSYSLISATVRKIVGNRIKV
jgi:hypothetical protein